jgi:ubiquinone/menaquinone biosynthesis C-methylase UbiE
MISAEFGKRLRISIMRRKALSHKPRNHAKYSRFDLEWDDEHLFPDVIYPDAEFLFRRMNEATLKSASPRPGELILDIGCGRGIDGARLAKRGAIVIGLEPSLVMLNHARKYISENGAYISLIRGIGENLPFQAESTDKVVCKGALDHFPQPAVVMEQMATVLKPGGKAIIAIANFNSLGFRLGKVVWRLRKMLGFKPHEGRMLWEMPEDHIYRFDYPVLKHMIKESLEVEEISGVSLFFGLPWWGIFLARLPRNVTSGILNLLDRIACHFPQFADVIIVRCRPKL